MKLMQELRFVLHRISTLTGGLGGRVLCIRYLR